MNDNTMKQPAAIVANSTTLTLIGIAIIAIVLRENRTWRDGLLGASDSAFYGTFAIGIAGAILLAMLFKHYSRIDRHIRYIVGDLAAKLRKQNSIAVEVVNVSDAEHQKSVSKLDEVLSWIYNDIPDWANPYLLFTRMKFELQKLEYCFENMFIIKEYISFVNYCMSRLEEFVWPENYFAMVQSVRMGGDEFLEHNLYPYIAKALSVASDMNDESEIQRHVIRLYITDFPSQHMFSDVDPPMKSRMDEVQVVDLVTLECHPIGESEDHNV